MRKKLYDIVEVSDEGGKASVIYDVVMLIAIISSLVTLTFKTITPVMHLIDLVTVVLFIIDYLLRWITADYKYGEKGITSFARYPFGLMAIVDLLSILPSITLLSNTFKILRIFRMMKFMRMARAFRVIRVFKLARYSKSVEIIMNVFRNSRDALAAVGTFAVVYIIVSALVVFNIEPDTFNTYFDAVYWATISLTTVGYGDVYCVTVIGKVVTMISSIFGIAIVALPAGIITAGYMEELQKIHSRNDDES